MATSTYLPRPGDAIPRQGASLRPPFPFPIFSGLALACGAKMPHCSLDPRIQNSPNQYPIKRCEVILHAA